MRFFSSAIYERDAQEFLFVEQLKDNLTFSTRVALMTEPSGKSATPGRVPHPIPHTPDVTSSQLSVDSVRRSVFVPLSTEEVRKLCLSGDKAMAAVMSQAQHLASPTTSGPASPRLVVTPADQISESVSIRLHDARRATSTTGRPSDQAVKLATTPGNIWWGSTLLPQLSP